MRKNTDTETANEISMGAGDKCSHCYGTDTHLENVTIQRHSGKVYVVTALLCATAGCRKMTFRRVVIDER